MLLISILPVLFTPLQPRPLVPTTLPTFCHQCRQVQLLLPFLTMLLYPFLRVCSSCSQYTVPLTHLQPPAPTGAVPPAMLFSPFCTCTFGAPTSRKLLTTFSHQYTSTLYTPAVTSIHQPSTHLQPPVYINPLHTCSHQYTSTLHTCSHQYTSTLYTPAATSIHQPSTHLHPPVYINPLHTFSHQCRQVQLLLQHSVFAGRGAATCSADAAGKLLRSCTCANF